MQKIQNEEQLSIEYLIQAAFLRDGTTRFWPEQFLAKNRAQQEVLAAFRVLEDDKKVNVFVTLWCDEQHEVWRGDPRKLEDARHTIECRECCPPTHDLDWHVTFEAMITPEWKATLK